MRTLFGVVTGTNVGKFEERIAWIWPLLDVTKGKCSFLTDPAEDFPPRGSIFWPRATALAVKGALVQFRAKEVDLPKENGDQFMVVEAQPALEVLDLRWVGEAEQVRVALSIGVQVPGIRLQRALIWCAGNCVVGPISLVSGANKETTLEKNDRARIQYFQMAEGDIHQFDYEGMVRSIIGKPSLGPPVGYFDWDDDKPVVKRGIEYALERAKSSRGVVDFSRQMLEEAVEELTKNSSSPDLRLKVYRLQRSLSLAGELKQAGGLAEEFIAGLLKHPSVLKEIAQIKLQEREKARADIEASLTTERDELARLREKRAAAESGLRAAQESLADTEASVEEQSRTVEGKIQARINEVLNAAPALLADIALLKPFLMGDRVSLVSAPPANVVPELIVEPWKRTQVLVKNAKELRARMIPAFKAMGLPTAAYQPIHAAFASGLLPVVAGSQAVDALQAYAHVATAGRLIVVQANSALADVQDVFGRVVARHFVPHADGLIDIVRAARKSDGLYLVVLDGINRGATESYLLPLIRAAVQHRGSIALFHPAAVETCDPNWAESRLEWPRNLLLAATLVEGPTTLPVAPDIWSEGVLIQVDLEGVPGARSGITSEPTEIDTAMFGAASSAEHSDWIRELAPSVQCVAERFEGGLGTLSNESATIQQSVAKGVIVPFLASIDDEAERLKEVKAVGKNVNPALGTWVSTARRRLS